MLDFTMEENRDSGFDYHYLSNQQESSILRVKTKKNKKFLALLEFLFP